MKFTELIFILIATNITLPARASEDIHTLEPADSIQNDSLLGFGPKPGSRMFEKKVVNGTASFEARYTIDRFGRRFVPGQNKSRDRFAAVFGCSFAFGEGLNDDETFEYFLAKELPQVRTYNYAFSGYGAQQMLARIQSNELRAQIPEKNGVALYYFMDEHLRRTLGTLDLLHSWRRMPDYEYENGRFIKKAASFEDGKPFAAFLTQFQWVRKLLQWRHLRFTNHDFDKFAELVSEARDDWQKQFPGSKFVVMISPKFASYADRLIPFLEKRGLIVWDYRPYEPLFKGARFYLPNDGHPSKDVARILEKTP